MLFGIRRTGSDAPQKLKLAIQEFAQASTHEERQNAFNAVCQQASVYVMLCIDSDDDHRACERFARSAIKRQLGLTTDLIFRSNYGLPPPSGPLEY
jgi:hypothetical protein